MMTSTMSALRSSASHVHVVGTHCPFCDQPIPNEMAQQVQARLEAKEREVSDAVAARLKEQFAADRVQIEANARASVEQANRESAAKLLDSAKREADAAETSRQKIEALTNTNTALQVKSQREIAAVRDELAQREAAARAEGATAAQTAAQDEINKLKQANADQAAAAQKRIEAIEAANTDVLSAAQQKIADAERLKVGAEAAARDRIAAAEMARAAAEANARTVKEQHDATLNEQREALEKDKTTALNARDAKHFEENQTLKDKLDEVQRKLENKTADELGEGGEVDLFEELKAHFESDRVRRVPKGTPGADIIHEIVEDGRLCGRSYMIRKSVSLGRPNMQPSSAKTKLRRERITQSSRS